MILYIINNHLINLNTQQNSHRVIIHNKVIRIIPIYLYKNVLFSNLPEIGVVQILSLAYLHLGAKIGESLLGDFSNTPSYHISPTSTR